jgi:hypothetical protein
VPIVSEIAIAQLEIGQFVPYGNSVWRRQVPEEDAYVAALVGDDGLVLSVNPAVHSWEGHHNKRITASIMYELAARYAEKVNGLVTQEGINVAECRGAGYSSRTLAVYPETRLDYSLLCPGFKAEFLGEET